MTKIKDDRGSNDLERKLDEAENVITLQEIEIKELTKDNDRLINKLGNLDNNNSAIYKGLINYWQTLGKDEVIEILTLRTAQLLKAEKEIDRLNEEAQLLELKK